MINSMGISSPTFTTAFVQRMLREMPCAFVPTIGGLPDSAATSIPFTASHPKTRIPLMVFIFIPLATESFPRNALRLPDHPLELLRPGISPIDLRHATDVAEQSVGRDFSRVGTRRQPLRQCARCSGQPHRGAGLLQRHRVAVEPHVPRVLAVIRRAGNPEADAHRAKRAGAVGIYFHRVERVAD